MGPNKFQSEENLLWQGKLHLGDATAVYGDAPYVGLSIEFPLEVFPYPPDDQASDGVSILIEAEGVRVFPGYPGHLVTVIGYTGVQAENSSKPPNWTEKVLAQGRLNDEDRKIELRLPSIDELPRFMSVRLRIDTTVAPGLYDELVLTRLALKSRTHYGFLGFRSPS
jgi:hypothetical protein